MTQMMTRWLAGAVSALVLAACGGPGAGEGEAASTQPAGRAQAQADGKTADRKPSKPKCPARTNAALTGPDIAGLKLGMTRDEALAVVNCHAPDAHIQFDANWFDRRTLNTYQTTLEKQAFTAQSGETSECDYRTYDGMQRCGMGNRVWDHVSETIRAATPGLPGQEVVVGVWRTQNYKEGDMPAVDRVIAALTEKYGPFQTRTVTPVRNHQWSDQIDLIWIRGVDDGVPLSEVNPAFSQCAHNVRARPGDGQSWRDGCGLSIRVMLLTPRTNPDVVREFHIGMMNQGDLYTYGEALQAELEAIEQKRRQDELDRAKSAGNIDL